MHTDPTDALRDSLSALRHNFFLVLGISVVVSILVYGIVNRIPGAYEVHVSSIISMEGNEVTPGFRYDGYYELSAIDLFSTTLARIADSPETIVAAYTRANIELPTQDAFQLVRTIVSEKAAPQLVRFTIRNASKDHAEQLSAALMLVLDDVIDEYNRAGRSSVVFHTVSTQPFTSYSVVDSIPVAASFFMLVFLGGNMYVLFREALRRGS